MNRVVQKPQFLNNFPEKNREFAAMYGKFSGTWERTARFLNKSNIKIRNFGENLLSRPAGKEAFLLAKAYIFTDISPPEEITLDFDEVKVMTPAWLDEFITEIKSEFTSELKYMNTGNPSADSPCDKQAVPF